MRATAAGAGTAQCPCGEGEQAPPAPVFPHARGPAREHPLVRCAACGLVFLNEPPVRPTHDDPHRFGPLAEAVVHSFRAARARFAARLAPPGGRVLDVGCGRGMFLEEMKRRGFAVRGTEASADLAAHAPAGIPVDSREFAPGSFEPGSFELVSIWHVLEHLPAPHLALRAAREVLVPGGTLVVAVPNFGSLQARCGGEHWQHLELPRHRFHFTPDTLRARLEAAGFRIERLRTGQWEMDPIGLLQSAWNRAGLPYNVLFDAARGRRGAGWRVALWVVLLVGGLPACLLCLCFRLAGRGGTIIAVARAPEAA